MSVAANLLRYSLKLRLPPGKGFKMSTAKVDVDGLIDEGREKINDFAEMGMDYVSSANSALTDFVRDEPLIAIASAFTVGYIAARILNHVTRR
jgi:hypothetical protein